MPSISGPMSKGMEQSQWLETCLDSHSIDPSDPGLLKDTPHAVSLVRLKGGLQICGASGTI